MESTDGSIPALEGDLPYLEESVLADEVEADLKEIPIGSLATKAYIVLPPDCPVRDAISKWKASGTHCAVIVDADRVAGIFTERDVLHKVAGHYEAACGAPVADYMTASPETLESHVPLVFGLNRMMIGGYRHIPITEKSKLIGLISVRDVLRYLHDRFPAIFQATGSPLGPSSCG